MYYILTCFKMFWIKIVSWGKGRFQNYEPSQKRLPYWAKYATKCVGTRGRVPGSQNWPLSRFASDLSQSQGRRVGRGRSPPQPPPPHLTEGYEHVDISKLVFSSTYILKYQLERKEWGMVGGSSYWFLMFRPPRLANFYNTWHGGVCVFNVTFLNT